MQKTLDLSIKYAETGTLDGAYAFNEKASYPSYMTQNDWDAFVEEMKVSYNQAYKELIAGSGGELKPQGHRPPKMASYGSSSRLIYRLSKSFMPQFHLEHKLSTYIGGIANIDGFMETDTSLYFIEAKCREPYGAKSKLIKSAYRKLYKYINDDPSCNLNIHLVETDKDNMIVTFSVGETIISTFDIKQMICHLLGIAMNVMNAPTQKAIKFLYLCYNPKLIEIIAPGKKNKIIATYDKMCSECRLIDFNALFKTIVSFLSVEISKETRTDLISQNYDFDFCFTLCDQSNYTDLLNN